MRKLLHRIEVSNGSLWYVLVVAKGPYRNSRLVSAVREMEKWWKPKGNTPNKGNRAGSQLRMIAH